MSGTTRHFRFMSLPREMQVEIANRMPMEDVKTLSLASRTMRTRLLPVLFGHLDLAGGFLEHGRERSPLPPELFEHVRSATFRLRVLSAQSREDSIDQARKSVHMQLGVLQLLPNLAKVTIHVRMLNNKGFREFPAESPALYYGSVIQAICNIPSGPEIALHMHGVPAFGRGTLSLFEAVLTPLTKAHLTSLQIDRHDDYEMALEGRNLTKAYETDEDFYQMFCLAAPKLRVLRLDVPNWLARRPHPPNLPMLETLSLAYEVRHQTAAGSLQYMPVMLDACGDRLACLDLSVRNTDDRTVDGAKTLAVTGSPRTPRQRSLRQMRFFHKAFTYLGRSLAAFTAADLTVSVKTGADWQLLMQKLSAKPQLPDVQHLLIDWNGEGSGGEHRFEADKPNYSSAKALLRPGIERSLYVSPCLFDTGVEALFRHLPDWGSDLLELHLNIPTRPFDLIQVCKDSKPILLERSRTVGITLTEERANPLAGFASRAQELLMQLLRAPLVESVSLDVDSIFSDCLESVTKAIEAGSFPSLRKIDGIVLLSRGDDPTCPLENLHDKRWQTLCGVCMDRDIDFSDLIFNRKEEESDIDDDDD